MESLQNPNPKDQTIDLETESPPDYHKKVNNVRNILFVIAAYQIISLFFIDNNSDDPTRTYVVIAVIVAIAAIFVCLGFLTKEKPYTAIVIGLILYSVLNIANIVLVPESVGKGLIIKIVFTVLMCMALTGARDIQYRKKLNKEIKADQG